MAEKVVNLIPRIHDLGKSVPTPQKRSRAAAIKAKCIECVGGRAERRFSVDIRNCSSYSCPLRPFRPYQ